MKVKDLIAVLTDPAEIWVPNDSGHSPYWKPCFTAKLSEVPELAEHTVYSIDAAWGKDGDPIIQVSLEREEDEE